MTEKARIGFLSTSPCGQGTRKNMGYWNTNGHHVATFTMTSWAMNSCGMSTLENLAGIDWIIGDGQLSTEEIVAGIWLGMTHNDADTRAPYASWNFLITTTGNRWDADRDHVKLFKEMGAKMLDRFPNLAHGPNDLVVARINLRDSIGKFVDALGQPLVKEQA